MQGFLKICSKRELFRSLLRFTSTSGSCVKAGVKPRVIERAGIDRAVGDQLFSGRRKPSRDRVIQLAFGFGLDVEETQQLLKIARHTFLYPKIKRDAAIIYCLARNMGLAETQNVLADFDLQTLSME